MTQNKRQKQTRKPVAYDAVFATDDDALIYEDIYFYLESLGLFKSVE